MNSKQKNSFSKIILIIFFAVNTLYAQQTPTFSEYNYNPFLINPAYAGLTNNAEISISNSGFINSFDGSPKTLSLTAQKAIGRNNLGLGFGVIRDEVGVTSASTFYAALSYRIYFDTQSTRPHWQNYIPGVLSFGITFGVQQYQNNLLDLGIVGDQAFSQNINATIPTIGFGAVFNHDTFYIGFSTPNLIGDALSSEKNLTLSNPYYGYFGYRFFESIFEDFIFKPNVLLKYENGTPLQADINTAVSYKNKIEFGLGYRTDNSVNILAGLYAFDNLRVIYNYNIPTNNSPLGNTHGIVLSYQFGEGYRRD